MANCFNCFNCFTATDEHTSDSESEQVQRQSEQVQRQQARVELLHAFPETPSPNEEVFKNDLIMFNAMAGDIGCESCVLLICCAYRMDYFIKVEDYHLSDELYLTSLRSEDLTGDVKWTLQFNNKLGFTTVKSVLHDGFLGSMLEDFQNFYLDSLRACQAHNAVGGKSNAAFCLTSNDHFMIKTIKKKEYDTIKRYGADFLNHFKAKDRVCLNKLYGVFEIFTEGKYYYLIITEKVRVVDGSDVISYDLKGLGRFRSNSDDCRTQLDSNFMSLMKQGGFSLSRADKRRLETAVENSCRFLEARGIIDYSLFITWDKGRGVISYAVIDFLCQFTIEKKLEFFAKASYQMLTLRRHPTTIVPPSKYSSRFVEFVKNSIEEHI